MIIVRSPLRISFVGGGSDLPAFCEKEAGYVVSTTIEDSVYIMLMDRHDSRYRISYSKNELVDSINEIEHDIVRNALSYMGVKVGLEIVSEANLSSGAGLGSSGAFTVGLVNALYARIGKHALPSTLYRTASIIEIELCKKPIGYQDQLASAHGGINFFGFYKDGFIDVEPLSYSKHIEDLEQRVLLVDTGVRGASTDALKKQVENLDMSDSRIVATYRSMANMAYAFKNALVDGKIDECGEIIGGSWSLKKAMSPEMTNDRIESMYSFARRHGAIGGKLCGAGGRGMFLFVAQDGKRESLASAVFDEFDMSPIFTKFSRSGSQVVYSS